jgi:hypothetical protein
VERTNCETLHNPVSPYFPCGFVCALIEHHAMKAYWGSGGIAPRIFDLGTLWRWVVSFTTRPLYPREWSPGTHWIEDRVGARAGPDAVVKRKITRPSYATPLSPPPPGPLASEYQTGLHMFRNGQHRAARDPAIWNSKKRTPPPLHPTQLTNVTLTRAVYICNCRIFLSGRQILSDPTCTPTSANKTAAAAMP